MRQHFIVPKPVFPHYVCYPDLFGRYSEFPQHAERRERGQLKHYNLHLIFSGSGYAVSGNGGERLELRAGDGFLYPKQAFQQYGANAGDPWDVRWIHFDTQLPLPMLREADAFGGWLFTFSARERFEELTEEMYACASPFATGSEPRLSALLYEILVELSQHSERLEGSSALEKQSAIRAAADHIRRRCEEPWSLERMAELAGYSPYHFLRLFRQVMGKTPNRYVAECRIVAAKLLLSTTSLTVTEIAARCGFAQTSYFIRVFRASEGLSPIEYRSIYG
ncbi:helix-turn-helix transcriptional regulator [Paenibacillus arenilitoris]|uniref:AraC family transcriptional regulator n=1 Tax=Paenibacillus arenilitoris TaxID=2772299 RepID=A0A927CLX1_9BACL|nr:AraC family transcriptional regulator [Paenibacillus arenilitoris]MBD2869227.1 AraC family transcriptional regulator [Paenibacillus arenilitoris]